MSLEGLDVALRELGVTCTIETRDTLAVLCPVGDVTAVADDAIRRRIVQAATAHGFTHVAIELPEDAAADEAVHRR